MHVVICSSLNQCIQALVLSLMYQKCLFLYLNIGAHSIGHTALNKVKIDIKFGRPHLLFVFNVTSTHYGYFATPYRDGEADAEIPGLICPYSFWIELSGYFTCPV